MLFNFSKNKLLTAFLFSVLISMFLFGDFFNLKVNATLLNNISDFKSGIGVGKSVIESNTDDVLTAQKLGKFVSLTGNVDQLKSFLKKLKNSNNNKIRIAHFGDSIILGDIITEYLRSNLQQKFGGGGVGILPIVSDDYRMRRTTIESFSNDWSFGSIVTGNKNQYPLGINGTVSVPKPGSWVKYESTPIFPQTSSFNIVKIFYSNADQSSTMQYSIDGGAMKNISLESGNDVKQLEINSPIKATKVKIKFLSGKEPYIYGVSLETNGNGVIVDNFPLRGNSGVSLLDILPSTLQQFDKYLSYDLVILNYGANVYFPNPAGFVLYENKMSEVIDQFKKAFPNAGILLVSVGDKTIKRGSNFITNPDVQLLLDSQKKIVKRTNIAFWNMWEAMGGLNSMNHWVNAAPPLALRDYSHFNNDGGERIAELLYDAFLAAMNNY